MGYEQFKPWLEHEQWCHNRRAKLVQAGTSSNLWWSKLSGPKNIRDVDAIAEKPRSTNTTVQAIQRIRKTTWAKPRNDQVDQLNSLTITWINSPWVSETTKYWNRSINSNFPPRVGNFPVVLGLIQLIRPIICQAELAIQFNECQQISEKDQ